jgi:hypothetical protein|tara:strand:- start:1164 stop:1364 length:201 start_codon:yes stop_codon:yes gene_type:complete
MSEHTKLVQIKEDRNNFSKFIILLKKSVSITMISRKNLMSAKDLKMGLFSSDKFFNVLFNIPGLRN